MHTCGCLAALAKVAQSLPLCFCNCASDFLVCVCAVNFVFQSCMEMLMWNCFLVELGCIIVHCVLLQVYLGEQYVNNPTLSDVTFLVEGRQLFPAIFMSATFHLSLFPAIFICLLLFIYVLGNLSFVAYETLLSGSSFLRSQDLSTCFFWAFRAMFDGGYRVRRIMLFQC